MTITSPTPTSFRRISAKAPVEEILKMFREDGGLVVEGFFTQEQIAKMNREIDPHLAKITCGTHRKVDEEAWITEFHGENTRRLSNLPTLSKTFRDEVLNYDLLHQICEAVFRKESGDYWMCTAQVIEIGPHSKAQQLHRDTAEFPGLTKLGPRMDEIQISFFTALTDFTAENGATRGIPKSHLWEDYEDWGCDEDAVPAVMKAGDVFFFTGRLCHGGGENRTEDFWRRGISLCFQASYLTPEECYPLIMPREIVESMTPLAQKMCAWRSQYPTLGGGLWQHNYTEVADAIELKANQPLKQ
ncbi:PhyH-domain-containing protein [Aspergillus eucalypticola CBS 122712]|uniref:PhyH-domain-containing protein n=1 Tax=Aspergillus eucalypticola (strain CBS 122712 / IBT 29274) TaxID=1448314 RepID=A0A317VVV0_ASPEC|nr:PhyH-domain-containing protein [Aspergillus eucalypticola CBS 122712]PWY77885.1 PhyH-domain-containing protein [Aspergillus eucalypticola CBS 122712]